jgi:hypothetical protein
MHIHRNNLGHHTIQFYSLVDEQKIFQAPAFVIGSFVFYSANQEPDFVTELVLVSEAARE